MTRPFFSVVVPTFNRADILTGTIASISKQLFTDFEIIIVDDGSKDRTEEVVKGLMLRESRIKYVRQENKERGAARNTGFRNAAGVYVDFFDSDDLMHPSHLEVLHKNIVEQNYPAFIATKFDFIDENGRHKSSDMQALRPGYYDHRLFLSGNPLACNVCVKRDYEGIHLFEEDRKYSIKEDWLFLIQNVRNERLYIVDEVSITMSDHAGRSMRSDNSTIIFRTKLAEQWILKNVQLNDEEMKMLSAHVNYFCGIHAYLEGQKKESIQFASEAIRFGGMKLKYISLLIKSMIGRSIIKKLR